MRIDLHGSIAGQPAGRVRDLLRAGRGGLWGAELAMARLRLPEGSATALLGTLAAEGLIALAEDCTGPRCWENTVAGNALANASALRPIARATADRLVSELIARVHEVNARACFLYRVRRLSVFGSYVGTAEKLGDVDLILELEPKEPDGSKHAARLQAHARQAAREGRRFGDWFAALAWADTEVRRFLRGGSRYLSFHTPDDAVAGASARVLFEVGTPSARAPRARAPRSPASGRRPRAPRTPR